ncbi:MAG: hypothetical protein AB7O78_19060 [Thermoleophilia bacterium]
MATSTATDIVRIGAKLYAENPGVIVADDYVPLFHGWIQRRSLDGTPIDVADYKHVPDGPGIMLIGHEADRALDFGEGRPGVLYQRKRDGAGSLEERFAAAIEAADRAAADIEADPAANGVRFGRDEILLRVNDRLNAPNDDATFDALGPAIVSALGAVRPGRDAELERVTDDPKGPLTIRVRLG